MDKINIEQLIYELENNNKSNFFSLPKKIDFSKYIDNFNFPIDLDIREIKDKDFFNQTSEEVVKISRIYHRTKAIVFDNCSFPKLSFSSVQIDSFLIFNNCRFNDISLSTIPLGYLIFIKCTFENCLELRDFNSSKVKLFGLFDTRALKELNLINTQLELVKIKGKKTEIGSIHIKNERINSLEIIDVKSIQNFEIDKSSSTPLKRASESQSLKISNVSINKITFKGLSKILDNFELSQLRKTKELVFENCGVEIDINIKESDIENIKFYNKCRLQNIYISNNHQTKSNFEFLNSDCEQSIFLKNCFFNKVEICKSKIYNGLYIENEKELENLGEKIQISESNITEIVVLKNYVERFAIEELTGNKNMSISQSRFVSLSVSFDGKIDEKSNFNLQDIQIYYSYPQF